jgi:hypothetical protein
MLFRKLKPFISDALELRKRRLYFGWLVSYNIRDAIEGKLFTAEVAEWVDATVSKTVGGRPPCRFESDLRHQQKSPLIMAPFD